ncbi:MAG: M61 family peptidase [Castellaniella sp.]|uniref:M61 family metallopeptidase n=1 Tax=Castellaniella sp. TaxID=1955812 RepID=UPI00121BA6F5|nr:PDZ domain-containing protein [Castellaniella sp.]TAN27312.1 MAG: M61 family peptidase [Castellaniella sp.]
MKNEPIRYQVRLTDPAGHRYTVRVTIAQPDPHGQSLRLPAWIPGSYLIRDFARQIESLQAHCNGKPLPVLKTDSDTWRCAPSTGPLTVEYTVYAWDLSVRGAHFDESHAFFNGASLFLAVAGQESTPCLLDIRPPAHARNWRVHTSLPAATGQPNAAAPLGFGTYLAGNYDALIDFPVEIGTPQHISFETHGAVHDLVFTGVVPALDLRRIANDVQKICAAQIELFEPDTRRAPFLDSARRYVFLVMVTGDGYGGLEHRASTALATRRSDLPTRGCAAPEGYTTFLGLVSHEYFHSWNVKRIKPAAFAPYDLSRRNHTRLLWVFEGFTSYYDDLMLLRAGVIDEPAYLKLLARSLDQVARAGGRHKQSVAESSFDAWTRYYKQDENSPNALVSYYTKGSLVALGLDLEIRRQTGRTHGLDDVLRLLWRRYGRDFYQGKPVGLAEGAMPALIAEATGADVDDFIRRHVEECKDIPLKAALAREGITLTARAEHARPTLAVRTQADPGGLRLATVHEHGPAHRSGLSAGDLVVAADHLRITDEASLNRLLDHHKPGDRVVVHVFRRDELRHYAVRLGRPEPLHHTLTRSRHGATA